MKRILATAALLGILFACGARTALLADQPAAPSDGGANDAPSTDGAGSEDGFRGVDAGDAGDGGEDAADGLSPFAPPSCTPGGLGMTNCGAGGNESCCASVDVEGGTFFRTYSWEGGAPTGEADPATVNSFRLDKYVVTVGRFRQFVQAWRGGYTPPAGSGKHAYLNGGMGLATTTTPGAYEPGWLASDNGQLAPTDDNLACDTPAPGIASPTYTTWTPTPDGHENLPIDCPNWWEAYAFCIWDGGFLPTEAEWEYAAAGGSQQRQYPWGSTDPGTANQYAIYECDYPGPALRCTGVANFAPVGTPVLGAGLFGQLDLAGEIFQWVLDGYAPYVDPCVDCANLSVTEGRVIRGGGFGSVKSILQPAIRVTELPTDRSHDIGLGLRCARSP